MKYERRQRRYREGRVGLVEMEGEAGGREGRRKRWERRKKEDILAEERRQSKLVEGIGRRWRVVTEAMMWEAVVYALKKEKGVQRSCRKGKQIFCILDFPKATLLCQKFLWHIKLQCVQSMKANKDKRALNEQLEERERREPTSKRAGQASEPRAVRQACQAFAINAK